MIDKSFNQRMVDNSRSFNRSPNDFVTNMIDKRNAQILSTFAETQQMEPRYRNFKYEYDALKFIDDNRKEIYWYSKDPREEANKKYLGSLIHTMFPDLPEEYAINHATQLIGDVAGDDMSATNVLQVFGKKVQEGFADAFLGIKSYFQNYGSVFEDYTNTPDEIKQKHRDELKRDIEEAEKRRVRTDYYSQEFNSLLDQMVLSAADFVPSMALSMVPEILGGVVAKIALAGKFINAALKFKRLGQGVSAIMAGLMEAGSITKDLIKAGADPQNTMRVANGVGVINGLLEYAGDLPEKKLTDQILGLKKLKQSVDGLSVSATKGTFTDIAKRAGIGYLAGLVTEPATEIAQEYVSMYAMNLASQWQELNKGKSFTEEFTYTPQEMADALWEVGTSTLKGQALIGVPFAGGAIAKEWNAVSGARKYSTYDSSSAFTENDSVYTNPNTKPFTPNTVEKDGVKQAELVKPANVVAINGKLYPVSAYDEARAAYMKTKSKGGMYVNIVDGSEFKSEAKANQEQASTFVANFRDKDTAFFVDKNGEIEVNTQDFSTAIEDAINLLGSEYTGIKDESTKEVKKATIFTKDMSYTITDNIAPDAEAVTTQSAYMQMLKDKGDRIAYVKKNFESELNKLFTRAGYKGEELTKAVEDYKALASRLDGTATNLVEEIKKLNPKADPDLQEQIVYGITGMVAEFAPVLDFSSDWARDHVVLDDKVSKSEGKYGGSSYWEVDGKTYKNFKQIPASKRADANFHIAVSELVNQTTGIHEIGHMALSLGEQKFLNDDYFKTAFYEELKKDNEGIEDEREWTIGDNTHEAFAEKLEAYINTGVAESKEQANLFNRILRAFKTFLDKIKESLTGDQLEFYDRLFSNYNEKTSEESQANTEVQEELDFGETERHQTVNTQLTEEAQKQYDDVVAKYKGTDQWMKAPNGKRTNLSERQWVMVRTPNFIRWFGDWLKLYNKKRIESLNPISIKTEINSVPDFFRNRGMKNRTQMVNWAYNQVQRKVVDSEIGRVQISKRGINDSLFHGHDKYKVSLYSVLDELIENGVLINELVEDGKRNWILANKIIRDGNTGYVGVVIKEDRQGNRYYDHTIMQKNNWTARSQSAKQSEAPTLHPAISNIIHDILNVNDDSVSKVVDENGEPLIVYHGTEIGDIEEFRVGQNAYYGAGIYFTDKREEAEKRVGYEFGDERFSFSDEDILNQIFGDNSSFDREMDRFVNPSFLNIKNPTYAGNISGPNADKSNYLIYLQRELINERREELNGDTSLKYDEYINGYNSRFDAIAREASKNFTEQTGFDGVIIPYKGWYLALQKDQIKSVYNDGEYKSETNTRHQTIKNADIYKAELESLEKDFANGKMLDYLEYKRYEGKSDWITAEREAARIAIDGDMIWMQNLLTNVIFDYMETSKFTYDDISEADWEKISQRFIKLANEKLADREKRKRNYKKQEITDYFNGRDPVKVIRRIFAWSQNTDEATKIRYWQNKYTGRDSKAGDQHILKLARKLKARGDLDDKVLYKDGREASQKYRFLDLVQQDAYKDGNYRTSRVNEAIWAGAQQEILNNSAELMAIDQDVALTSGGKAVRENGIEDSEIEANFLNVTERDLAKARKKAEEAKEQTKTAKKELDEALKENDAIKAEMEDVNKTLAKTAEKLGVDTEGLETTEEYVEAIKKAGKDIAKEDSKLNKRIETVKDKLKDSNEKVRELRNDVLLKDKEIADLKINERVQERKIIRLGNSIAEYIDKLKKEKREDAAYRKVVEKTIKDAESAIEAMTDLKVENQELANEIKAKARTIREQTKELNNTSKLLMKERKTTDKLKKEINLDNAVIAQLDENLAEAFYNLDKALKDRAKFFRQRNNLEEELAYVRARRLVENSRRNWHDLLRKRSGDATMDRHLETFDKAFFQRNDTFKVLDIDGNKGLKDIISMSGTLDNPDGSKRFVDSLYTVLEKNGLIKNGKLIGGFNQLPLGQYKKISDAIRVARAYADAQKTARVEARAELVRDISNLASADIEKLGLTKDQYKEAKKRYDNGEFETLEMAELKVWQEGLRYQHEGTKSQTDKKKKIGFSVRNGINPNNNVAFNSFTSGYNLLGSISPTLQKLFYFGNADMEGINQVTDNFLKKVEERKKMVEDAVNNEFNGDKKQIRQFYKDTQKKVTTKELDIDHEEAPRWLEMSQTWNNFLETQDYRKDFVDNELTLEEVIGIYEHAKQEEDLAHLLNDRTNLSARQVAWIVNEFEKEDGVFHKYKAIADAYQKAYEYAWDRFQKVANDVYDVALTHYDFYSPARSADNDTDITLGYDFDSKGNPLQYGKKMTMKERADMQMKMGGNNPIRLSYITSFNSIVRSQEWFINGAEFFKNWNDIMKNDGGGVRRMIDDRIGSGASDTVMKWMRSVANSEFDDVTSGLNKIMDGIRNRMALANLGFSVSSTMQQPSVLFLAASKFGVKNMFKAMQEIKKVGGYKAFRDYVHEMAPQIKASADVNMMYAQQAIRDSKFLKTIGLAQDIAEIGMKGIEFSDQICRCITWQAGYQYYIDKGMTSEEASMHATQDTMNMNSSRQAKDNSLAYNSKNPLWKGLLMFTNQLNKQWNMLIGEDGVQALMRKDIKTFVSTILGLGMATSWVLLAKGKIVNNSDDDEKWWEDLWLDYLGEGISMVPVIGDKISSVINGYSYLDSDLITSMSNFVKAVAGKDDDKKGAKITTAWKNVMVDAFELAGAPKVGLKNTYNALFEDGKWKGEDFFSEGRYWRTILPYEWYQFVTGDKD